MEGGFQGRVQGRRRGECYCLRGRTVWKQLLVGGCSVQHEVWIDTLAWRLLLGVQDGRAVGDELRMAERRSQGVRKLDSNNKQGASPGVEKEGGSHRLAAATAMGKPTMPWESWKPHH